jgi:hypothetical protein
MIPLVVGRTIRLWSIQLLPISFVQSTKINIFDLQLDPFKIFKKNPWTNSLEMWKIKCKTRPNGFTNYLKFLGLELEDLSNKTNNLSHIGLPIYPRERSKLKLPFE